MMKTRVSLTIAAALSLCAPAQAQQSVESFYKGKTIDFYIGFSPGGGYDFYARLLARFMGEHIPGKPSIIAKNMAGGGSRTAASYMYTVAPKDGTAIATVDQSTPVQQAVGDPTIKFDTAKFNFIGNPVVDNNVVVTWHTSGVKTIEDATKKEYAIGATGYNTSFQYPQSLNIIAGTKFKIILGYPGANEINLAMENGELVGRGSNSWASYKGTKPDWVRDKKINVLVQIGLKKANDLPDVPLLMDFAKNDEDRAALKLLSAPPNIGRPVFAPPGLPAERVKALRDAFDATMKDAAFLEQAKREGLDIDPISGEQLQKVVNDILSAPQSVRDRLAALIEVNQTGGGGK